MERPGAAAATAGAWSWVPWQRERGGLGSGVSQTLSGPKTTGRPPSRGHRPPPRASLPILSHSGGVAAASPLPSAPGAPSWERPVPGVRSLLPCAALGQVWQVALSGTEACPGLGQIGGQIGGGAQGAPVCRGVGRSQPSGAGTASYLDSAVRCYCLAWWRKMQINQLASLSVPRAVGVASTSWHLDQEARIF